MTWITPPGPADAYFPTGGGARTGRFKSTNRPAQPATADLGATTLPNFVDEHVGAKLRSLRVQQAMTQTELATRLGISFQQVQKYERGANRISASTLYAASRVLNAAVQDFFADLDKANAAPSFVDVPDPAAADFEVLRALNCLDDVGVKKAFVALASALSQAASVTGGGITASRRLKPTLTAYATRPTSEFVASRERSGPQSHGSQFESGCRALA